MRAERRKAIFVAMAAFALSAAQPMSEPELRVVVGAVEIGTGDPPTWHAARVGEVLRSGDSLRTGEGARAELETSAGTVRMYPRSLLRVPPLPDESRRIDLDHGASIFDVRHRDGATPIEVHTPHAVVMVKGTQFTVSDDEDGASVAVSRGLVSVRSASGSERELLVHPGFGVSGGAGRDFSLGLLRESRAEPWAAWSKGALPERPTMPARESRAAPGLASARAAAHVAASRDVAELAEQGMSRTRIEEKGVTPAEGVAREASDSSGPVAQPPASAVKTDKELDDDKERVSTQFGAALLGPPAQYTIEVLKSGNADTVHIAGAGGLDASFTENQLKQVVNGNTAVLGPQLLGVLSSRGLSPSAFAHQMLELL